VFPRSPSPAVLCRLEVLVPSAEADRELGVLKAWLSENMSGAVNVKAEAVKVHRDSERTARGVRKLRAERKVAEELRARGFRRLGLSTMVPNMCR